MESTELDELITASDGDDDLVRKLRGVAKDLSAGRKAAEKERDEALARVRDYDRAKVFDEVGIPNEGAGVLLREALANESEITAETVRQKAIATGILPGPAPEAGVGEQEAHKLIESASTSAPPAEKSLAEQFKDASSPGEILRIVEEASARGEAI